MAISWIAQEQGLTAASLTVRAQTISPNDNGQLLWDAFFPRKDVDSVKIREIVTTDWRPVADRREWNADGRMIPVLTPNMRDVEMVPIESFFRLGERELQELLERTVGNEDLFRQIVKSQIPPRVDGLASANYRRIEIDSMKAWANGSITVMNPVTATSVTVSYGFSGTRYTTAGTAWNNGGINGYDAFLTWLEGAVDLVGPIAGVVMRLATFKAIQADCPNPWSNISGILATRSQVEQRVQDDIGGPFRFYIIENSLDVFTTGGTAVTRTKVWPAQKVAVVPAAGPVGFTAFAPVASAFEIARSAPGAAVDLRGMTATYTPENGGKALKAAVQVNAFPVPNEQLMCVIDAGV
jgi:hypothetical protein